MPISNKSKLVLNDKLSKLRTAKKETDNKISTLAEELERLKIVRDSINSEISDIQNDVK